MDTLKQLKRKFEISLPSTDQIAVFSLTHGKAYKIAGRCEGEQLILYLITRSLLSDSCSLNETKLFFVGTVKLVPPVQLSLQFSCPSSSAEQIININNISSINKDISRNKNNAAMFHLLFYDLCVNVIIPLKLVSEKCLGFTFFSVWN